MKPLSIIKNGIYISSLNIALINNAYSANRKYELGTSGNSFFDSVIGGLQTIVNVLTGPGIMFVVIVSFVVAFALWTYKPDSKAMMFVTRVIIAAICLFNLGLFLAWVQS